MKGNLYFDEVEKKWYVNWLNQPEMYPSIALSGKIVLHPDDVEMIEIFQMYLGVDTTLQGKEVEYEIINHSAKLTGPDTNYELSLYSEVEKAIIEWSIDGKKTAGELTRKIFKILEK